MTTLARPPDSSTRIGETFCIDAHALVMSYEICLPPLWTLNWMPDGHFLRKGAALPDLFAVQPEQRRNTTERRGNTGQDDERIVRTEVLKHRPAD